MSFVTLKVPGPLSSPPPLRGGNISKIGKGIPGLTR
jgi:hypothetical protein